MSAPDPEYVDLLRRYQQQGGLDARERLHTRYVTLLRGGATTAGLPFPDPTDPVAEGADAIRALAEAVDTRALYGGYMRVRSTLPQSGYGADWLAVPFDEVAASQPTTPPGVSYDPAKRAFVIAKAGIWLLDTSVTMSGGTFSVRLRVTKPNVQTVAIQDASSQLYTGGCAGFGFLPVGAELQAQVLSTAGTLSSQADNPDNPTSMSITHLPYLP